MRIFALLSEWILRNRAITSLALLAMLGLSALGTTRVVADFSVEAFFGADDHEVEELALYKQTWGEDDSVLIVTLQAEEGDLLSEERLQLISDLTAVLEEAPSVESTASLANSPSILGELPGMIELRSVVATYPGEGDRLAAWRQRVLENSALVPLLLSEDARSGSVVVVLDVHGDNVRLLAPVVNEVRALVSSFDGREGVRLGTAGIPVVRADFFKLIFENQRTLVPSIMFMVAVLLMLLFRRLHGALIPGFAALLPTLIVFGAMGFFGESIGIMNQNYATLLPAIVLADAIHLVSRFHEEARGLAAPGERLTREQRHQAIILATQRIGLACLLTSATTGIGFLSLRLANMPILKGYGTYAALGIVAAYATVLMVIPLALSFTRGPVPGQDRGSLERVNGKLRSCGRFSIERPWVVLACTGAILAVCLLLSQRVVVDNVLTGMLEEEHPTSLAGALVDTELGGVLGIEIETTGPDGSLKTPDVLAALAGLEAWALEQDGVRSVQGPASMLGLFARATRADGSLPESKEAIAQTFLLGESAGLEYFILLGDSEGGEGYARSRTVLRIRDQGGRWIDDFSKRLQRKLDHLFKDVSAKPHITGTPFVAYRGVNRVTEDLRASLWVAFIIIGAVILLLFRSPRIALLSFLPNAMPLLVGYGLLGLTGWELDPAPAVIFIIALGIAVDDTIHLIVRWREELDNGRSNEDAILESVVHTGRAVTVTTIVLALGFGVNVLSSFPMMTVLAALGATVVTTALLCDLFLLPALLVLWGIPASAPSRPELEG